MRFQGHYRCKKDLISSFDETRSFQFLLFKISHIEDKDFYLGRDKSNLREHVGVLAFFFYPPKGKIDYPFPLSIPPPKTENQKAEKKEKIEKIKKKKRQNFLRFFPVAPLPLFHKKEFKRKEKKKKTFSISLSFPTPKEEKRAKRRRKETKEKEKEEKKEK